MTAIDIDPTAPLRDALVSTLVNQGALTSSEWIAAFGAIPRHLFAPRGVVPGPRGLTPYDTESDDATARADGLAHAYSNTTLITQFDGGGTATSSSSEPSLMAKMLELLDVRDGHRVLEIGTGTGYNAGLLSHRVGDQNVVTIDLDPNLVDAARAALRRAGYNPTVIAGDGADGAPEHGPYDRIIVTCGLDRIPSAWLRQVRPGAVIVANLGIGLARLVVDEIDSASGQFVGPASFMHIRLDTTSRATSTRDVLDLTSGTGTTRTATRIDHLDAEAPVFLRSLVMPGVHRVGIHNTDGEVDIADWDAYHVVDDVSGSWFRAERLPADRVLLTERGPRPLWDEMAALVEQWIGHGRPELARYGLTVTADGGHVLWLDEPGHLVATL